MQIFANGKQFLKSFLEFYVIYLYKNEMGENLIIVALKKMAKKQSEKNNFLIMFVAYCQL